MLRKLTVSFVLSLITCMPLVLRAQEIKPPTPRSASVYRIEYVFSEMQNDKRINARSYSVVLRSHERGSIRLGNRIPVSFSTKENANQLQYLDVGVNIDSRVDDTDVPDANTGVDIFTNIDISNLPPEQAQDNRTGAPVVRQTKFQNENIVPLGKSVLLSSADEVDGTRRLQIEVTATKLR
ncbi:MAG: hypothetical protein JOZ10_14835 [Acidobacteria bacterium]|nr:hypothetical protein [Acidobacteriota bacterium]MBV9144347.1 hypothetical protein [Acidobacteriota bacterium]MBV9434968.1 hypothetical protein [Acidobacteriota bacterium]